MNTKKIFSFGEVGKNDLQPVPDNNPFGGSQLGPKELKELSPKFDPFSPVQKFEIDPTPDHFQIPQPPKKK